jgi:hypothetical protein
MYTQNLKNMLVLTITGNPFALRGEEAYENLERTLSVQLSAVVINRSEFSGNKFLRKMPYPKPVTLLSRD